MKNLNNSKSIDFNDPKYIYKKFKENKIQNANLIIDLLKELEGNDLKKVRKSLAVIHKIFCQLIKDGEVIQRKANISDDAEDKSLKIKYERWIYERYNEVNEQLIKMVLNEKFSIQLRELAFSVIIKFIKKEAIYPITPETLPSCSFPIQRLMDFYSNLLNEHNNAIIIKKLKEHFQLPDFLYFSLHALADVIQNLQKKEMSFIFQENLLSFLYMIDFPKDEKKPLNHPKLFCSKDSSEDNDENTDISKYIFPIKEGKKKLNFIWESVLSSKLSPIVYKHCLILLPEKVMMHLEQPVRLTDFFMNAYNTGGVSSILALQGVYVLVTQYNLEYTDFYDKLYALFQPSIFHAKYKPRFFMLCNKFFLSPYLPEYVVAAFIKRCSRLMLTAPSSSIILLLKFVVNLLFRYPSLKRLMHNPDAANVEDDPYIADEPKPLLCRAGESSLWEVATLRQHPLCGVSKAANFIYRNLPDMEHDISKHVETSYNDVYEKASRIKEPRIATTFYKPEGLFKYSDDSMSSVWDVL